MAGLARGMGCWPSSHQSISCSLSGGKKKRKKKIDNKIIKNNNSQAELEVLACISLSWITQIPRGRYMGMGRWA